MEQGILNIGTSVRLLDSELHGILIVVHGVVDSTHHTLIITEEENGQAGHAVDGDEKTALLQLVDHIVLGNDVHVGGRTMPGRCDAIREEYVRRVVDE